MYDPKSSQAFISRLSFDSMLEGGPLIRPGGGANQEEEEVEDGGDGGQQEEDLHSLLVKAWEAKVFPVIQRRFRNDQERKSGLDPIRGALQLGTLSLPPSLPPSPSLSLPPSLYTHTHTCTYIPFSLSLSPLRYGEYCSRNCRVPI